MFAAFRTSALIAVLAANTGTLWAEPFPLVRWPTPEELLRADAIVVLELQQDALLNDEQAVKKLAKLPLREAVFQGAPLRGKVVETLKGNAPPKLTIKSGAALLYDKNFQQPARRGQRLLLFLRKTDDRLWLDTYGHPDAMHAARHAAAHDDNRPYPLLRYTKVTLQTLALQSRQAAFDHLQAARDEATADQWICDLLLDRWRESPPREPLTATHLTHLVDAAAAGTPDEQKAAWQCLSDAYEQLAADQIRQLASGEDDAYFDDLHRILILSIRRLSQDDPKLPTDLARLKHLPEDLRSQMYAHATGLHQNTIGYKRHELRDISLADAMQSSTCTRQELIAHFAPLAKRYAENPGATHLGRAGCILSEVQWVPLETLALQVLQRDLSRPDIDPEHISIVVQDLGPYDSAIQEVIAQYHQLAENNAPHAAAVLTGLAWSRNPAAVELVHQLADPQGTPLARTAWRLECEMAAQFGPHYPGHTDDEAAQLIENLTEEFTGDGAAETWSKPHDTPGHISQRFRLLIQLGGRETLKNLWEAVTEDLGRTQRSRRIVAELVFSRDPWVHEQMLALWQNCGGTLLERDVLRHLLARSQQSPTENQAFARQVLADPQRRGGTRSHAAYFLSRSPNHENMAALYQAMQTAPWKPRQDTSPSPWPVMQQCEVNSLDRTFVAAAVQWHGPPALSWCHEFAHAGKIDPYQMAWAILQLDPQLQHRQSFHYLVRMACLNPYQSPPAGLNDQRRYLDRLFGHRFFPAQSNADEVQAWLAAYDSTELTPQNRHWAED